MFIPGETATHRFSIPFTASEISKVVVTYKQHNRVLLEKEISSFEGNEVVLTLSQAESLLFECNTEFSVQLNILMADETTRCASDVKYSTTGTQLNREEVIVNE